MIMRHDVAGRGVLVELVDGRLLTGRHYASSTGDDRKELAIADPLEWRSDGAWHALDDTRIVYVAEKDIRLMKLSRTQTEKDAYDTANPTTPRCNHSAEWRDAGSGRIGDDAAGRGPRANVAIRTSDTGSDVTASATHHVSDNTDIGRSE
jgi:hypothetical protein